MSLQINIKTDSVTLAGEGFSYTLPLPDADKEPNNVILENGEDFDSNSIETITYEPGTGTLGVKFDSSDTLYRYVDVPLHKVFSFVRAYSLNEYWRNDIKPHYVTLDKVNFSEYVKTL